ncbi:MAG: DNA-processing protein DprA [Dehalococcoidia bacterium]|nr:DNA processing protein DprA [Chloroflexota bacterium]MBT9162260.1 DNA processing protein DprA [Chloroflexota bacterium]
MSEIKYWVGFNMIPGIGRVRFGRLLEYFGDMGKAWHANMAELIAAGLDHRSANTIVARRPKIELDAAMDRLDRYNVKVLTQNDPSFPQRLKEIYDVPPVLYVRGTLIPDDEWALAVVGTRHATMYGREVTQRLTTDLARNKITIVSGLARGIDSIAHRAALAAGGRTIAVFACGLDMVYPAENRELAQEIMKHGALVSDYPLGAKPKAENFPRRNRIMSGMSLGVLVVEAAEKSGAMITANLALQQDREVFAVPGSILSAASRGSNFLIREGAKAVLEVNDILEELNLNIVPQQLELLVPENANESLLLKYLSQEPRHIDELCRYSSLPIPTVSSTLTMMELKGMVNQLGNMNYVIARGAN